MKTSRWNGRLGAAGIVLGLSSQATPAAAQATVTVDLSKRADYPLLKTKFNLYTTAIPKTSQFLRDAAHLKELNVESMRFEHNWQFNATFASSVGGTADSPTFNWADKDAWQAAALAGGVLAHWAYDYCPATLCPPTETDPYDGKPKDGRSVPPAAGWTKVVTGTATHAAELGNAMRSPTIYNEIWNEPDFCFVLPGEPNKHGCFLTTDNVDLATGNWFFRGAQQDLFAVYETSAKAIRAVDQDAKVGGPATAQCCRDGDWLTPFASSAKSRGLPLDFLSFHGYKLDNNHIPDARKALGMDPYFAQTEMVMSEFNSFASWPQDGDQQKFSGAATMLSQFLTFLEIPELTSLNWAQLGDACDEADTKCGSAIGLIARTGERKAAFHALAAYGWMPVDRNVTTVANGVQAFASSDPHRIGVIVLNTTSGAQTTTVKLQNPSFAKGKVSVFPIDAQHNSWYETHADAFTPVTAASDVALANYLWSGTLPAGAMVFLKIEDGSGDTLNAPVDAARVIRVNRYYPQRGATRSYADFDRKTWIARLGMAGESAADQEVGVTADTFPPKLRFVVSASGSLRKADVQSLLGVRIDYQVGGAYTYARLFHGLIGGVDVYDAGRTAAMPFGSKKKHDDVVAVPDFSDFSVDLGEKAPAGWTGRAQITYILQNAGTDAYAMIRTLPVGAPIIAGDAGVEGTNPIGVDSGAGGASAGSGVGSGGTAGASSTSGHTAGSGNDISPHGTPGAGSDEGCSCSTIARRPSRVGATLGFVAACAAMAWRRRRHVIG